ncbi:MAG: cupin domain-containing protein [Clostridiales bacterium]|jgi:transcriptional regulator with XRE-family HTH domain|nr:cupin domain-containing protein [Clostridiales bacterium]
MRIGEKIRQLRLKNGLTQEELADRCELTKGFISQVERELTSPSIATLVDILECLGTDLKGFFSDNIQEKVVFKTEDVFEKQDCELNHTIRWLIPNAQKNNMEPILMHLEASGSSGEDDPHDGEEFGYVISGSIYLYLGSRKYRVKRGESFYFRPTVAHRIENAGKSKAVVLWVSSPPSF